MAHETQNSKIIRHLREHGSITSAEAYEKYRILRLSARIAQLKARGYTITTIMEYAENPFGRDIHYARYFLEGRA